MQALNRPALQLVRSAAPAWLAGAGLVPSAGLGGQMTRARSTQGAAGRDGTLQGVVFDMDGAQAAGRTCLHHPCLKHYAWRRHADDTVHPLRCDEARCSSVLPALSLSRCARVLSQLRRRLGIPTGDVLDVIASWPPDRQKEGNAILKDVEDAVSAL